MSVPILVVIVGPIASGKSTIAAAVGDRLRQSGRQVAVLDLDDVVETIGGFVDLPPERFRHAQMVLGKLVGSCIDHGFDVIAHGPFFQQDEDRALLQAVPADIAPRRVLLHCTLDIALQRVAGDADRVLSASPEFLRATYKRVEELLPTMPRSEWEFDPTFNDARSIVDEIADALMH